MKIYLAGPDVFRLDATMYGEQLKRLCARHGFEGLFPLDTPAVPGDGAARARTIYRANLALIAQADVVLANLNPFRGAEPDSGTAFEVGHAVALGKPVWAYAGDLRPMVERLTGSRTADGHHVDGQGRIIENFGLGLNLMLACGATLVEGDAAACLEHLARHYGKRPERPTFSPTETS